MSHRTRLAAWLGIAVLALAAAPAARADSLLYARDGNVWLANPDGSGAYQVTLDGTAASPYESPSQADDGTIVAIRDRKLYHLSQAGRLLNAPVGTPAPGTGALDARVSPNGALVAYAFVTTVSDPLCTFCATAEGEALISHSDRFTDANELGRPHLGGWPTWVGNDTILVETSSATQWYYVLGRPEAQEWFNDGLFTQQGFQTLLDGEVAATGDRMALVRGNNQETLVLLALNGAPPAAPSLPDPRCAGYVSSTFANPTWSSDGGTLAWAEPDGVWVASVPADLRTCAGLPQPALRVPGAKEPDLGPAAINPGPRPGCGNPGNPTPCTGPTPVAARLKALVAAKALKRLRLRDLARKRQFKVTFSAPVAGTLTVALSARGATIAGARKVFKAPARATVKVRVTRAGAKRLKRARTLKVRLVARFTPAGGKRVQAGKTLTLRR